EACQRLIARESQAAFLLNVTRDTVTEISGNGSSAFSYLLHSESMSDFFEASVQNIQDPAQVRAYRAIYDRDALLASFAGGVTHLSLDCRYALPDREPYWLSLPVNLTRNPLTGDIIGYTHTVDITVQKNAQLLLNSVIDLDYDYILRLNLNQNRYEMYFNAKSATALPAASCEDYVSELGSFLRAHCLPEEVDSVIARMQPDFLRDRLAEMPLYEFTHRLREKDGSVSYKRLQFSYLDAARGIVLTTRVDTTRLFEEEQEKNSVLAAALTAAQQANATKSEFLSRMSHEIRTPMNAILGMTAIASQVLGDDRQVEDCLDKIGVSSRFLLSLINDILDMSRIESGKLLLKNQSFLFAELLNSLTVLGEAQATRKHITFTTTVSPGLDAVYIGDSTKLQQVLVNILSNAVKFTPAGGRVSLAVRQTAKTAAG
ncbi:MAG: histidine kinase dimerization/phospho-acceptor domain-containing protein, partial [Oscillospiraceae bacterium]